MLPYTVYNGYSDILVECESCYIHEVQKTMIEQGYSVKEVIYTFGSDTVFMRMWKEEEQKDD